MNKKERLAEILCLLDDHYSVTECYLEYQAPWQLLVATILSAQCTDDRVNQVTPALFERYPSPEALAGAELSELERLVKSTGFYHNKAKHIKAAMAALVEGYGGEMPSSIEELTALPGVGRKTANVIRCHVHNIPSVVVDTHVNRISQRLGLTKNTDPAKVEQDLMKALPREHWLRYNLQIIAHGRAICKAPTPRCEMCFMTHCCPHCQ